MTMTEHFERARDCALAGLFGAFFIGIFFGSLIAAAIGFVVSVVSYRNFIKEDEESVRKLREEADRLTVDAPKRTRPRPHPLRL